MARRYFTLITKSSDGRWSPQFGDYDREVVVDEMRDEYAGKVCRIISTNDDTASINERIALVQSGRA